MFTYNLIRNPDGWFVLQTPIFVVNKYLRSLGDSVASEYMNPDAPKNYRCWSIGSFVAANVLICDLENRFGE